jgi:tryptophan synthase beta chain
VHAAVELARTMPKDAIVVINVSGRGDKDVNEVIRLLGR